MPVRGGRAPTLWVSRRAPELDAAPVEAVERPEIRPHVTRERADTPSFQARPNRLRSEAVSERRRLKYRIPPACQSPRATVG